MNLTEKQPKEKKNFIWEVLIKNFQEQLKRVFEHGYTVELIEADDSNGGAKALRIISNEGKSIREVRVIQFIDWDDTSEAYSKRKDAFHRDLRVLFESFDILPEVFSYLNKVCRVLPPSRIHPEKYSGYLECAAVSYLREQCRSGIKNEVHEKFLNDPTEDHAREFMVFFVKEKFADKIEVVMEAGKIYFVQKEEHSLQFLIFEDNSQIDEEVLDLFLQEMTSSVASDSAHLDSILDDDGYWIINTFGDLAFQLEKILNTLLYRKHRKQRLPDEIILYLEGRKVSILESMIGKIVQKFGRKKFEIIDDSLGQIEPILKSMTLGVLYVQALLVLKRVVLQGAKRSKQQTPEEVEEILL